MKVVLEFLSQYGYILAYTALTAIAGFLGAQIKKRIDRVTADKEKRKAVETVVKAVEQMYQDLSGREKLEKAKENTPFRANMVSEVKSKWK